MIFRPRAENIHIGHVGERFAPVALTDHHDHVVWTDGTRQWKWRLPDQAEGHAGYPTLAKVVIATLNPGRVGGHPGAWAASLDSSDAVIGWIRSGGRVKVNFALPWVPLLIPSEAFDGLRQRGVEIVEETFRNERQFYLQHPDRTAGWLTSFLGRHVVAVIAGFVIAVFGIAMLIIVMTGNFYQ
ncbi:MAG: hypothetical protein ACYC1D_02715 [Acidimicrobiales bacterium]